MKYFGSIALATLLSAASLFAESNQMRVTIPFQFIAGEKALPAGDYRVDVDPASSFVKFSPVGRGEAVWLGGHFSQRDVVRDDAGVVAFHQYGNTYFLHGVWKAGQSAGYEMAKSRHEREMAKEQGPARLASLRAVAN